MSWLVRLVTPTGGRILDPFAGSGTTGCAAIAEGFGFTGIEREEQWVEVARLRCGRAEDEARAAAPLFAQAEVTP